MSQPLVVPLDSPWRTDASHELLRTEPFQVKLSEWLCETPPLKRKMVPAPDWLYGTFALPPAVPTSPGLAVLSVLDEYATFERADTAPVCASPAQPVASDERPSAPTRELDTSIR